MDIDLAFQGQTSPQSVDIVDAFLEATMCAPFERSLSRDVSTESIIGGVVGKLLKVTSTCPS